MHEADNCAVCIDTYELAYNKFHSSQSFINTMTHAKHLTQEQQLHVVFYSNMGWNMSAISREMGISRLTVRNLIKKHTKTESVKNTAGQSHPKISNIRQDRLLARLVKKNRWKSSQELATDWKEATGVVAEPSMIRKRLLKLGFRS